MMPRLAYAAAKVPMPVRSSSSTVFPKKFIKSSPSRIINCNVDNTPSGIGDVANVFMNYMLDQGFTNPYDKNGLIIIYTGSGGDKIDGRMRFDYETFPVGVKLNLWVKTHKEALKQSFARDGWCSTF